MDRVVKCLVVLCCVVLAGLVVLLVDMATADVVPVGAAVVVGKTYSPSHTSVGTVVGGKGVQSVVTYHPDKWVVIVQCQGDVLPVKTSAEKWADADEGESVHVRQRQGLLFAYDYELE